MSKENKKEKKLKEDNNEKELIVKKEKIHKERRGKWLRETSLTILLIAIIVAACIGINLFVEDKNFADFDVTEDKIYSLSDMSKSIIDSIDKEVDIKLVNMNESVEDFANKYNSENNKIKVEVITDVTSRPDLTDEYGITADTSIIIIECGDKQKNINKL